MIEADMERPIAITPLATTDGWRGLCGRDWSEAEILGIVKGIAEAGLLGNRTVIGFDGRAGAREIAAMAAQLIDDLVEDVVISRTATPTPAVGRFVHDAEWSSGIVITASHNPPGYLGVKIRDSTGASVGTEKRGYLGDIFPYRDFARFARPRPIPTVDIGQVYRHGQLTRFFEATANFEGSILFDLAYGSVGAIAAVRERVQWLRTPPLPYFGGITPDPMLSEYRADWPALLGAKNSDIIFGTDGDGDRLVAYTLHSGFIAPSELACLLLKRTDPPFAVIASEVAPRMVDLCASRLGMDVWRAPVGFHNLVDQRSRSAKGAAMAVEPNGAIVVGTDEGDFFDRDGIATARYVIEAFGSTAALDRAVRELRDEFPTKYETISVAGPMERLLDVFHVLTKSGWQGEEIGPGVFRLVAESSRGWVTIRNSGTEPQARAYIDVEPSLLVSDNWLGDAITKARQLSSESAVRTSR